jgi:hypothetical protein
MKETPRFEQAVERFREVLAEQGWSSSIVWRSPEDVVVAWTSSWSFGVAHLKRRTTGRSGTTRSGAVRDWVSLSTVCEVGGSVCATIFWTTDDLEASQLMMPTQGLKMSTAVPRSLGQSVSWLGCWLARREASVGYVAA